jgi:hypothetical protein
LYQLVSEHLGVSKFDVDSLMNALSHLSRELGIFQSCDNLPLERIGGFDIEIHCGIFRMDLDADVFFSLTVNIIL